MRLRVRAAALDIETGLDVEAFLVLAMKGRRNSKVSARDNCRRRGLGAVRVDEHPSEIGVRSKYRFAWGLTNTKALKWPIKYAPLPEAVILGALIAGDGPANMRSAQSPSAAVQNRSSPGDWR